MDRAMEYEVSGRFHSAEECEAACNSEEYVYFGLQWKGQCFCSNRPQYDKHGSESGCDCCGDDVGANKMCVWMIGDTEPGCEDGGAPGAPYLGCFEDLQRDRAMEYEVRGRGHSPKECRDECSEKGMKYFSRQWRGQCFCSEDDDYDKHGVAKDCDCCGDNVGGKKQCVWST
eukprot:CAMPEP_0183704974 /NCGR_PEP_ID=MMETSP0737-20130205/2180_1 /TAXON_ID=385413 /ORGANISM="Thalassiosira miniscula, Strain CCMP1093" /LENGTH=171 /DNA_ID=CAMNT_0025932015 /DNA_START=253 /DNA_END=768 /DNA_ORIENTATION=-